MQIKRRLLIFTGAGFSNSLSPKFFTTQGFYDVLKEGKEGFLEHLGYIEGRLDSESRDKNAESLAQKISQIIYSLKMLANEHERIMVSGAAAPLNNDSSKNRAALENQFISLRRHINEIVLKHLGQNLNQKERKHATEVRDFFYKLAEQFNLNIFSTNYDKLIKYLHDLYGYHLEGPDNIVNPNKLMQDGKPFSYIPLKGMLDWREDEDDPGIIKEGLDLRHTYENIITMPLEDRSAPSREPFKSFYQFFGKQLESASHLLFIGFAFNDIHINPLINNHSASYKKVVVVTLDSTEGLQKFKARLKRYVFSNCSDVHYMRKGFDKHARDEIIVQLRETE